jgi:AcrR family transcriptional regulator
MVGTGKEMRNLDTNTLSLLLKATEELIQEKGCQQTTMQDIMQRTGLSKGGIYHYVKSKDELFGMILENSMDAMDQKFWEAVEQETNRQVQGPLLTIVNTLMNRDIHNQIFIYLLSQQHQPKIASMLEQLDIRAKALAKEWIQVGQEHGAIPAHLDAEWISNFFLTLSYGLRVQQMINQGSTVPTLQDFLTVMVRTLSEGDVK